MAKRTVGTGDPLCADNPYARQKIRAEVALKRSYIIRSSFLSSSHRVFKIGEPKINAQSLWNGVTAFEFARLLANGAFNQTVTTLGSARFTTWGALADRFDKRATHDPSLPNNQCILTSDIVQIRPLEDQFAELEAYLCHGAIR
jgi:hypothetical protein